jgi:hypothetical protein
LDDDGCKLDQMGSELDVSEQLIWCKLDHN